MSADGRTERSSILAAVVFPYETTQSAAIGDTQQPAVDSTVLRSQWSTISSTVIEAYWSADPATVGSTVVDTVSSTQRSSIDSASDMSERPTELISDVSAVHAAHWRTEQPTVDAAQ